MSGFAVFLVAASTVFALGLSAPGVKMALGMIEDDMDVNESGLFGAFIISFALLFVLPWLVVGYWAFCWAVALGFYLYKQGRRAVQKIPDNHT